MLDVQSEDPKFKLRPELVIAGYVFGSSKFKALLVIANFFGSEVSLKLGPGYQQQFTLSTVPTFKPNKSKFLKLLSNFPLLLNLLHPCSFEKK